MISIKFIVIIGIPIHCISILAIAVNHTPGIDWNYSLIQQVYSELMTKLENVRSPGFSALKIPLSDLGFNANSTLDSAHGISTPQFSSKNEEKRALEVSQFVKRSITVDEDKRARELVPRIIWRVLKKRFAHLQQISHGPELTQLSSQQADQILSFVNTEAQTLLLEINSEIESNSFKELKSESVFDNMTWALFNFNLKIASDLRKKAILKYFATKYLSILLSESRGSFSGLEWNNFTNVSNTKLPALFFLLLSKFQLILPQGYSPGRDFYEENSATYRDYGNICNQIF